MRGGERLVKECSWMCGMCSGLYHLTWIFETLSYRCPSSVMVNNRFRSADYLPCQLPLGGSQGVEDLRFYHPTNRSIPEPGGSTASRPLQRACAFIWVLLSIRGVIQSSSKLKVNECAGLACGKQNQAAKYNQENQKKGFEISPSISGQRREPFHHGQ